MGRSSREPGEDTPDYYDPPTDMVERALIGFSVPGTVTGSDSQADRVRILRTAYTRLANSLLKACPNSFELDNALARLRESMFWGINSICHE